MKKFQRILAIAAVLGGLSRTAYAVVELFTPVSIAPDELVCFLVNVGPKPIVVSAIVLSSNNGANITFNGDCPTSPNTLAPGHACSSFTTTGSPVVGYCHFTASSSRVRGSLLALNSTAQVTNTVPATK